MELSEVSGHTAADRDFSSWLWSLKKCTRILTLPTQVAIHACIGLDVTSEPVFGAARLSLVAMRPLPDREVVRSAEQGSSHCGVSDMVAARIS
jgi:hypothetical protein